MVGSKCRDFKNREVSNVNAPTFEKIAPPPPPQKKKKKKKKFRMPPKMLPYVLCTITPSSGETLANLIFGS